MTQPRLSMSISLSPCQLYGLRDVHSKFVTCQTKNLSCYLTKDMYYIHILHFLRGPFFSLHAIHYYREEAMIVEVQSAHFTLRVKLPDKMGKPCSFTTIVVPFNLISVTYLRWVSLKWWITVSHPLFRFIWYVMFSSIATSISFTAHSIIVELIVR